MSVRRSIYLVCLCALLSGCADGSGISARYEIERRVWKAQLHERRININFIRTSQKDLYLAVAAFEQVLNFNPEATPEAEFWDEDLLDEIRRIRIASTIALGNLYFLSEQYYRAGDFYLNSLELPIGLEASLQVQLGLTRAMYLTGEEDSLEVYSADLFRSIRSSEAFWRGEIELDAIFVNLPIVLVRIYLERGDIARAESASREALAFYERIIVAWPEKEIAARSAMSIVKLHLAREEWKQAIATIDRIVEGGGAAGEGLNLLLLKGEVLAHGLGQNSAAEAVFKELTRGDPDTYAAHAAQFNIALLRLDAGDKTSALRMLRELETRDDAIEEVASRAMLVRAIQLEKDGIWDEALPILRRILRLYPYTQSAAQTPLVSTRHYLSLGDKAMARRSLERGTEYYLSLIDRASKYAGDRQAIEDYLVESYLMMGEAEEVAELLETKSTRWDDATSAGGMFRSALIYSEILEDQDRAMEILEKCIELFPDTRYAKIARRQLKALEGGS